MDEMEEIIKKPKTWLNVIKISAKGLLALVFAFFFVIATLFVVAPKFDAKVFKLFNFTKAEESCYVRAYDMSENNADLYNLIIFESKLQNYEKELYYLNLLLNDDKYEEFYKKLDSSAIQTVSDKSIVAYACNTNSYLINQKIKCMYELGFDAGVSPTVRNYVKSILENDYLFDTAFVTYIELINNDENLSKEEKQTKMEIIYSMVDTMLTKRFIDLKNYLQDEDINLVQRIIAQNALVNIRKADYIIDTVNESEEVEISKEAYEKALADYNELIK